MAMGRERICGEQCMLASPVGPGRDWELWPPLKRVTEGERRIRVELAHTYGKRTPGGPAEMPEDTESLFPKLVVPRLNQGSELHGKLL